MVLRFDSTEDCKEYLQKLEAVSLAAERESPDLSWAAYMLGDLVRQYAGNADQLFQIASEGSRQLQEFLGPNPPGREEFGKRMSGILIGRAPDLEEFWNRISMEDLPDFLGSVRPAIDQAEAALLKLEKNPADGEQFNEIFRFFHTLKSEASMIGFVKLGIVAHLVEHFFEKIRGGELQLDSEVVTLTLDVMDQIKSLLRLLETDVSAALAVDITPIEDRAFAVLHGKFYAQDSPPAQAPATPSPAATGEPEFTACVPQIDFSLGLDLFSDFVSESLDHMASVEKSLLTLEKNPGVAEEVNKIFRGFHTIKGLAGFLNLDDIRRLSHETETMMDMVRQNKIPLDSAVVELVLRAVDSTRQLLGLLSEQLAANGALKSPYLDVSGLWRDIRDFNVRNSGGPQPASPKLGEILVNTGCITDQELQAALEKQQSEAPEKKIGEILVQNNLSTPGQVERGLSEQQRGGVADSSIKIGVDKLDSLIETVGELVITGAMVEQNHVVQGSSDMRLVRDVRLLGKTIRDIQGIAMSMRLVPIRPLFQKMQRLIRDLSKKSAKAIELCMIGEDTEVDKNVIDLIADPMMHMIRNAADHGIESPDQRAQAGKPPTGTITLSACHKGGSVVIEIRDDGAGLRRDKIVAKAMEKGLIRENAQLSDSQVYNLIFEPGFSTADRVTDISGRGVGMDVVRKNVDQLRGKIDIETIPGQGTVFYIKLPLTLASIDGIILELGEEQFIAPIYSISEFIQPCEKDYVRVASGDELLKIRGDMIPLIRLDRVFGLKARYSRIEEATACVVDTEFGRACFLVDSLVSQQQVVIKNLGNMFKHVEGIAGATILGNGRVGLILDMNTLVGIYRNRMGSGH